MTTSSQATVLASTGSSIVSGASPCANGSNLPSAGSSVSPSVHAGAATVRTSVVPSWLTVPVIVTTDRRPSSEVVSTALRKITTSGEEAHAPQPSASAEPSSSSASGELNVFWDLGPSSSQAVEKSRWSMASMKARVATASGAFTASSVIRRAPCGASLAGAVGDPGGSAVGTGVAVGRSCDRLAEGDGAGSLAVGVDDGVTAGGDTRSIRSGSCRKFIVARASTAMIAATVIAWVVWRSKRRRRRILRTRATNAGVTVKSPSRSWRDARSRRMTTSGLRGASRLIGPLPPLIAVPRAWPDRGRCWT
jgi:hypothetical protein